jgi:hypothetical protein
MCASPTLHSPNRVSGLAETKSKAGPGHCDADQEDFVVRHFAGADLSSALRKVIHHGKSNHS